MSMQMLLLTAKWLFSSHEFDNQADAWPSTCKSTVIYTRSQLNVEYDAFFSTEISKWKVSPLSRSVYFRVF